MRTTPDQLVLWQSGFFKLNGTILFTWVVMAVLVIGALVATRNLSTGRTVGRLQSVLEAIVSTVRNQMRDMLGRGGLTYLSFIGTLFLLISLSNLLTVVPLYEPPTGSISMTAALAIAVFVAVPAFGIAERGLGGYLELYLKPSVFMLPFTIIGELSRTLALAVRLFGNIMSGTMIVGVLLSIAPILVPLVMDVLGLILGQIQAYIFAALATVYIGSGIRTQDQKKRREEGAAREESATHEDRAAHAEGTAREERATHEDRAAPAAGQEGADRQQASRNTQEDIHG